MKSSYINFQIKNEIKMNNSILIIGGRGNLSKNLKIMIPEATIIPSNHIKDLGSLLKSAGKSSIVYNVCYKSSLLAKRDSPKDYARYSFEILSEFVSICLKYENLIDKIIFTSSSAVYGDNSFAKESDPTNATSLYASLKLSSELFIKEHLAHTSIILHITRIFNMYGGFDDFSVIYFISKALTEKNSFTLVNNGKSVRDFIHVLDVIEIYKRLLSNNSSSTLNIGSGTGLSIIGVVELAEGIFNTNLVKTNLKLDEPAISCASTDNLIAKVGAIKFIHISGYFEEKYKKIKDGGAT